MTKLKSGSNSEKDHEKFIIFNCCSTSFMNLLFTLFLRITAKYINNTFYEDCRNNNILHKDFRNKQH